MNILVMNSGSSTLKLALYKFDSQSSDCDSNAVWSAAGDVHWEEMSEAEQERAVTGMLAGKLPVALPEVEAVGHRVVHGGDQYAGPVLIDSQVESDIERFAQFAPVHNPINLRGIRIAGKLFPAARQVAVFDTAFHSSLPAHAYIYPVPYAWHEDWGIRRYGFHGISHAYASRRAAELLGRPASSLRVITCHLGNGCSLAAVAGGVCLDTTMGFTPLEGLMMGNRSGSVDPGMLLHLLRQGKCSVDELNETLNYGSGLEGVSGISSDMREIESRMAAGNTRARLAFYIFVHRLRASVAAMTASLGGLDALVFTAGMGENSRVVREEACAGLGFLSVELDPDKNAATGSDDVDISTASSPVRVLVVHAREDLEIARGCLDVTKGRV